MAEIRYLPTNLVSRLGIRTARLADDDTAEEITRLAEEAFAAGYQDGYVRAAMDAYRNAEAKERRRAESHEDTCPARRTHPKCQCATPPGDDRG